MRVFDAPLVVPGNVVHRLMRCLALEIIEDAAEERALPEPDHVRGREAPWYTVLRLDNDDDLAAIDALVGKRRAGPRGLWAELRAMQKERDGKCNGVAREGTEAG